MKILLTEGSSASCRQALWGLGRNHEVDILDPSPLCQCRFSRLVRRWYRCPSFSREPRAYLAFLVDRLRRGHYDVLLPTHEQVYLLARFQEELRQYAALAVPSFEAIELMMGKASFIRVLDQLGLPYPATRIVRDRPGLLEATTFPCFVKLAFSTAGEGVRAIGDRQQLERCADEFQAAGWLDGNAEILVQAPAVGRKRAATAIARHGRILASHCVETRAVGVGGSGMAEVGVDHQEIIQPLQRIAEHFQWHGAICIEYFFEPETGRVELLECNPRIAQSGNAWLSGLNLAELLVDVSLDRPVEPPAPARLGVRSHQGFLVLMAAALNGAGRGELLREIIRARRGKGLYRDSENELSRLGDDWLSVVPATAVSALLVAYPKAAQTLVRRTVLNYSLHQTAVEAMRTFDPSDIFSQPSEASGTST